MNQLDLFDPADGVAAIRRSGAVQAERRVPASMSGAVRMMCAKSGFGARPSTWSGVPFYKP
jgi:hypothetical protein